MKKQNLLKLIVGIGLVVVLAISIPLMSGCTNPAGEPTSGEEPIKIGVATDITGVMAEDGRHHVRAMNWVRDQINAEGGLLGRPVQVIVVDTGANTPSELAAARDALKAADVDVIFTMWWLNSVASQYILEVGVPMIQQGWVSTDWEAAWEVRDKYPNFVFLNRDEEGYGAPYFQALTSPEMVPWQYPNKKAAIMMPDFDYSIRQATWWAEEAERNGWEIVLFESHPINGIEYGPQLMKIRQENPAIIYFCSNFSKEVIAAYTDFLEDPTDSIFAFTWVIEKPEFRAAMGELGNGVMGTLPGASFVDSIYTGDNSQYMDNYQKGKTFKEEYTAAYGELPSIAGLLGVDQFWVWAEAVKLVGDVTDYDGVTAMMMENDYVGITGTYGIDPATQAGHYGVDTIPINYYQMQDGKVVTLALGSGRDVEHITDFEMPWWIEE